MTDNSNLLRRIVRRAKRYFHVLNAPSVPPVVAPKKILITQRELKNFGGSEFFAIEVARALKNRGCEVAIYCPSPGKLANIVTPSGIPVCETPDAVPFVPDVIHGQHHLPTMAALAQFPGVPAIYCWHGARPWVENPPIHPRIRFHVVTSARMAPRLATETGTPEDRVVTIPNFVDLERFSRVRKTSDRPTRAVLYGQAGFNTAELAMLEDACAANDISLDKVGYAYGNPRPRPEYFLPDYDIAFSIGRCAIEAMACGCAVIPIVPQLAGSLITLDTFDDWAASNFSPRYYRSANIMDAEWLRREVALITAQGVQQVTQKVRNEHAIDPAIDAFEALYERAMQADAPKGSGAEFSNYLTMMAKDMDAIWGDLECRKVDDLAAQARIRELEQAHAEAEKRVRDLTYLLLKDDGVSKPE
ncbi:MAG: glycosyltransferase family 4 protein [Sulfitobacter sp.]